MDDRQNSLPFRRLSVAVAGAAVLVAVSVGGAIAASSGDDPGAPEPSVSASVPPDEGSGGSVGVSEGGTSDGSANAGTSGGSDPSPSPSSPTTPRSRTSPPRRASWSN